LRLIKFDILTLSPDEVMPLLTAGVIGRGIKHGHFSVQAHQIRDFTANKQKQVDDYPYGGGHGMVMMAQPLYDCLEHVKKIRGNGHVILTAPQGERLTQQIAKRLVKLDHIILVCGRYEGIDQRFIDKCVDEQISIGDFVITGGEIAAQAIIDATARLIPGVLADEEGFERESHYTPGYLEHPQYTRPGMWMDMRVPDVLLSGNHSEIEKWKTERSIEPANKNY
jgi:tRNA (guanine37-N1)-methyltransferase